MENGDIIEVQDPTIINNVGGSTIINGFFEVKYIGKSKDRDLDKKYVGELIKDEDIANAKKMGITNYTPQDYKDLHTEKIYQKVLKAYNNYNPQFVYFNNIDIF